MPHITTGSKLIIPASLVAEIVGCGPTMVRLVRSGQRSDKTRLGARIALTDMLLNEGTDALINKIKELSMPNHWKIEKLAAGETFTTKEKGNSMVPLIYSNQPHILAPVKAEDIQVGDIVFCKVKGSLFTHIVKSIDEKKGFQIGNNRGHINGWTHNVYGRVVEVLPMAK